MTGPPSWGVCAQVRAGAAAVETFVAWHLHLGAERVLVYFDDPEDGAAASLARLAPRVKVFRCDAAHWERLGGARPERKTARQTANALHAYKRTRVDWLAHIDVDEFILPLGEAATVAGMLAGVDGGTDIVRLRPYEALAEPGGGAPMQFRGSPPTGPTRASVVRHLYGAHSAGLIDGMLSHSVGKSLSRTGVRGLAPRIHVPRLNGEMVTGVGFTRGVVLLHYHAVAVADWLAHLEYRTSMGAYSGRPASKAFFEAANRAELLAFYDGVQVARPELLAALQEEGLLLTAMPPLEAVRATVFG